MSFSNYTIFVDESGTLPDPKDPYVIVAAVSTKNVTDLGITKKVRKTIAGKKLPEIKFYRSGKNTKSLFLKILARQDIEIFTLTVEKEGKKIPDTPENFALLVSQLIQECLNFYKFSVHEIVFDRHFHKESDRKIFDLTLEKMLRYPIKISHVNSQTAVAVNTADMVAGSLFWSRTGKDKQFYELIKDKIVVEKLMRWKTLKSRLYPQK